MAFKSDVDAKRVFCEKLMEQGYQSAEPIAQPADIVATKDGETWYYEIKLTEHTDKYFGAATLTEWEQAFKTPDRFRFVIAIRHHDGNYEFREYTPAEFMEFSTIPPFKVYFNIRLDGKQSQKSNSKRTAIQLSHQNFKEMNTLFQKLKE